MSMSKLRLTVLAALLGTGAVSAHADWAFTFTPSTVTAPDSRTFGNDTPGGNVGRLSSGTIVGTTYNFLDTWGFTLSPGADVASFVGSINFTNSLGAVTQGIDNLQLRLVGPSSVNVVGWSTVNNLGNNTQIAFSTLSAQPYAAGNYSLQVRGKITGNVASYGGNLQAISSVPLPAAAPLMLAGLSLLGGAAWRRRRPTDRD